MKSQQHWGWIKIQKKKTISNEWKMKQINTDIHTKNEDLAKSTRIFNLEREKETKHENK